MKLILALVAIGDCPVHFFRRLTRLLNGRSPFFPSPLQLVIQAGALFTATGVISSRNAGKERLFVEVSLVALALLMPMVAYVISMALFSLVVIAHPQPTTGQKTMMDRLPFGKQLHSPLPPEYRTIGRSVTYKALDYKMAFWAYVYFTIYLLTALAVFIGLAMSLFIIDALSSMLTPYLLFILAPLSLFLLALTPRRLVIAPYASMLQCLIPKSEHEDEIAQSFGAVQLLGNWCPLTTDRDRMESLHYSYTIPRAARSEVLSKLSEFWDETRDRMTQLQDAVAHEGTQAFARFVLTRAVHAEFLALLIESRCIDWFEMFTHAPQAYEDLSSMLACKQISKERLSTEFRRSVEELRIKS